ncbi:unnamed protein product [Caenorhabditis auriculariae]|uniref:Uncharacterized protein n=1 Tax=Caenorhabditis auriculariae TaxID=2777116 RepID=A0A8S1HFE9_9PELO|nr:unnamed protein product [Caenorhabditis auriculariae]
MSAFLERVHAEASKLKKKFKETSRKRKGPSAEEAINNLREAEEKIASETEAAKKYSKTNKKMALAALKRKKLHEIELGRIDGVLTKLEGQRTALENVGMHGEVLDVLGKTNEALKKANMNMDIDKVADLMDDIAEGLATSEELNEAISRPIGDLVDEDDLLKELQELQDNVAPLPETALPEVPAGPVTRARASREKIRKMNTMEELEQWAAAN